MPDLAYVLLTVKRQLQGKGIAADSVATTSKLESAVQELETREKGVDLCVLMDGTGSMVSNCIF